MRLVTVFLFLTSACALMPHRPDFFRYATRYDVLCEDAKYPRGVKSILDIAILGSGLSGLSVEDRAGGSFGLRLEECVFESLQKTKRASEVLHPDELFQTICTLGEFEFEEHDLQLLGEDSAINYLRKTNGRIWILPKKKCPLFSQPIRE